MRTKTFGKFDNRGVGMEVELNVAMRHRLLPGVNVVGMVLFVHRLSFPNRQWQVGNTYAPHSTVILSRRSNSVTVRYSNYFRSCVIVSAITFPTLLGYSAQEAGMSKGGVASNVMPLLDWQLTGHDGGF